MTEPENLNDSQFGPMKPYYPHRGSPEKRAQPTQGKLFQEGPPQTAARYPRGYTPQRMGEVRKATDYLINEPELHSFSLTGSSLTSPYNVRGGKRLAQEDIARSDVPVKHLEGLGRISLRSGLRGSGFGLEDRLGSYSPASRAIDIEPMRGDLGTARGLITSKEQLRKNKGISRVQAQSMYGSALIHEIGHHVDFTRRRISGSEERTKRFLSSPTGRGKAEGEADRYMLQRFRTDPRTKGFTPETQTYGAMGLLYRGYPKDLVRRGQGAREAEKGRQEIETQTNLRRKGAASQTRKALTRYRQQQKRRRR
jgi:hypothetical protein